MKADRSKSGINSSEKKNEGAAWNISYKKEQRVKMSWLTPTHYFPKNIAAVTRSYFTARVETMHE